MRVLTRPAAWLLLPVLVGLLAVGPPASAHPGGLDASGCHTTRKTGDYHCHRAARAPATSAPSPGVAVPGVVKKSRTGICHAQEPRTTRRPCISRSTSRSKPVWRAEGGSRKAEA
jgi:hypothetical protein